MKLRTVAHELGSELMVMASPEAVLESQLLPQANSIFIQFQEFGADASLFVDACRRRAADIPVIAVLERASTSDAVRCSRDGYFECLDTLSDTEEIFRVFEASNTKINRARAEKASLATEPWRQHLIGKSTPMEQITKVIRLVAARRCTVLITGETGTGKEVAARAIHLASERSRRPMVAVNCSAIPENLIEAELFGHVKGAFTGAVNARIGRFEQANGGTIFLDEIGDLPLDLQAKLLRVLQERELQRLGSSETVKLDVRVIAATNANLQQMVQQGRFREDLYYRLNVVPLHLPALRERKSDIGLLAEHFVGKICRSEGLPVKEISPEAIHCLCEYAWPGNVRQLENVIEHAVIMSGERDRLYPSDFAIPRPVPHLAVSPSQTSTMQQPLPDEGLDFTEALRAFERAILQQALNKAQGNKTLAADMLKLPRTTLIHKLRVLQSAVA